VSVTEPPFALRVTLVHGTWPRGIVPYFAKHPLWFEEGSAFRTQLMGSFSKNNIRCEIDAFLWSGANSILDRANAALRLTEQLEDERRAVGSRQMIIAHSHGGNVAVRAVSKIATTPDGKNQTPLIVTMATPFVELHSYLNPELYLKAMQGLVPGRTRGVTYGMFSVIIFGFIVAGLAAVTVSTLGETPLSWLVIVGAFVAILYRHSRWKRGITRRKEIVQRLVAATRLDCDNVRKLLIVRAIDDEASLTLAFGAILNRLVPAAIVVMYWAFIYWWVVCWYYFLSNLWKSGIPKQFEELQAMWLMATFSTLDWLALLSAIAGALFVAFVLGRSVYGREMAMAPLECQINTQSVPDGSDLSKVVTLVSADRVRGLRHGIYDLDDCAPTIAQWACDELVKNPPGAKFRI
jgi:hypothetical protein